MDITALIGAATQAMEGLQALNLRPVLASSVEEASFQDKLALLDKSYALRTLADRISNICGEAEDQALTFRLKCRFHNFYEGSTPIPLTMGEYQVLDAKMPYSKYAARHRRKTSTRLVCVAFEDVKEVQDETKNFKLVLFAAAVVKMDATTLRNDAKIEAYIGAYDRLSTTPLGVFVPSAWGYQKTVQTLRCAIHKLGCYHSPDNSYPGTEVHPFHGYGEISSVRSRVVSNHQLFALALEWSKQNIWEPSDIKN